MGRRAWWSPTDDELLRKIEEIATPGFGRYKELVTKRADRTDEETKEMIELRTLLNRLDAFGRNILAKNPLLAQDERLCPHGKRRHDCAGPTHDGCSHCCADHNSDGSCSGESGDCACPGLWWPN